MNSLITRDGKYIGQYLHIKDSEFSIRMFTKFYNLATHDNDFLIDPETTKDLIHTGKYSAKSNKIYTNDPYSEYTILKSLKIGDYMVFIQETNKIFILDETEFISFMSTNDYISAESVTYVLGIDNGVEFNNMRVIVGDSLNTAKDIYMKRFNLAEEPICIGVIEKDHLTILSDKYRFEVPLIM